MIIIPEQSIKNYFSKPPFTTNNFSIFESDCKDECCKLNGNFEDYIILNADNIKKYLKKDEKSVDRIIFLKKQLIKS